MDLAHTHLVLGVDLGQLHLLPEDAIDLVQLDGLLPVVEGAGDKNFVGRVFPVAKISRRRSDGRRRDAPGEGVFAHVGGGRRDRAGRGGGVSFGDGSERRIDKGCGGYASPSAELARLVGSRNLHRQAGPPTPRKLARLVNATGTC